MKNICGYSLIELLLVIVLTGILAPYIAGPMIHVFKGFHDISNRNNIDEEVRTVMDRMVREIRSVRRDARNNSTIRVAKKKKIEFENAASSKISFSWDGTAKDDLLRGEKTLLPARMISDFSITYYDKNNKLYDSISNLENASVEKIMLFLEVKEGEDRITVQREVFLRNLIGY